MADAWTDHTFNPWSGCTKVSPGCKNCYAEVNYSVKMRGVKWGPQGNRIVASESMWKQPIKWDREAKALGVRKRVFCASLADVFEDWDGPMLNAKNQVMLRDYGSESTGEWGANGKCDSRRKDWCDLTMQDVRDRLFRLIDATPNLDWLVLTKRPENIAAMMPPINPIGLPHLAGSMTIQTADGKSKVCTVSNLVGMDALERGEVVKVSGVRPNLWIGTSVENQQSADERIPHLLKVPAAVRFLSCEPLLGPVNLRLMDTRVDLDDGSQTAGIDWVIVGVEVNPDPGPEPDDGGLTAGNAVGSSDRSCCRGILRTGAH